MLKAIVFDLDNTLVNFWEFKQESSKAAAEAMVGAGLEMSVERATDLIFKIYKVNGIEYQLTFTDMLKPFKFEKSKMERIRNAAITAYLRTKEKMLSPYPEVVEMLEALKGKYRLAVLTDAERGQAHQRISFVKLEGYFDAVGTFHDTNIYKPGVEPFKNILSKLQVEPHEALMVGDNPSRDILGAKAVGMRTCFARYGHNFGDDGTKAEFTIAKPSELVGIIKKIE